ncbi:MAG: GIY-YIG nuclease family protein [Patescibacteria group bacterium]|nr:GIY-YIG nuclease family protein [Patescibacteria group bacterium]
MSRWFVYLVRCRDGSLYAGVTTDLAVRVREHNSGRGAKYTRSRRPVKLVWSVSASNRSAALRREAAIKRLPRPEKMALCAKARKTKI